MEGTSRRTKSLVALGLFLLVRLNGSRGLRKLSQGTLTGSGVGRDRIPVGSRAFSADLFHITTLAQRQKWIFQQPF